MTEHPDIAVLLTAKSTFDAQVIAGVLRDAGIPVYVAGQALNDEWALSRALANLAQVRIHVPSDRLEEARRALRAADESAKLLDSPDFDPGEGERPDED